MSWGLLHTCPAGSPVAKSAEALQALVEGEGLGRAGLTSPVSVLPGPFALRKSQPVLLERPGLGSPLGSGGSICTCVLSWPLLRLPWLENCPGRGSLTLTWLSPSGPEKHPGHHAGALMPRPWAGRGQPMGLAALALVTFSLVKVPGTGSTPGPAPVLCGQKCTEPVPASSSRVKQRCVHVPH